MFKMPEDLNELDELMDDLKYKSYLLHNECGAAVYLIYTPCRNWMVKIDWCDNYCVVTKTHKTPLGALQEMVDKIREKEDSYKSTRNQT